MAGRRSAMHSRERGAVLVETAILIPVVLLITFGLIEFSSAYQSSSVASASARDCGAHRLGRGAAPDVRDRCGGGGGTALQTVAGRRARRDVGLPRQRRPATRSRAASRNVHHELHQVHVGARRPQASTPRIRPAAAGRYTTQNACNTTNWDSVGVYVKLKHKFLTKLFGANINLADHAVFRLEPAPTQLCP